MISEPQPDVRRLLERMVIRFGDEPFIAERPSPAQLRSVDALLVETAAPDGEALAQLAHASNPSIAIVCSSVAAPPQELAERGVDFAAVLIKPFAAGELEEAIDRVLLPDGELVSEGAC